MTAAARRLSRLDWLTPLPGAESRAMEAIVPFPDTLGDGSTSEAVTDHLLAMGRAS